MGPWLCSHGNLAKIREQGAPPRLQWGRGCVATEILPGLSTSARVPTLQWGRGCVATEMTSYVFAFSPTLTSFNGAVAV